MQTHNILKPVLYATWLAGQYNDPVDIFYQLFADAQAVGRSVGIELPDQVNFDGAKTFAANSETGKHDKRQGFFAEVKQDKDGAIHPVITFHSFREGGKAAYWNPRDILFNQYRNNSDAPKYDPEKYKAKAAELAKQSEAARQAREVMEMAGYSLASQAAATAFNAAQEATEHAYLTAKGIKAHGSKVATKTIKATLYSTREQEIKPDSYVCNQGELLIPIFSKAGVLVNLQRIKPDGTKLFLSGGKTSGCFYKLQGVDDGQALAAEGFATAASVCEATGKSVYFALSANNLKTICAENLDIGAVAADSGKAGIDAAYATGLPFLAPAGLKDGDDWNDYTSTCGIDATKQALAQLEVKERQQQHTYLNAAGDKERKKAFVIAQANTLSPTKSKPQKLHRDAESLADKINAALGQLLDSDLAIANPEVVSNILNGAFWSGAKSKLYMLNEDQSLVQFLQTHAFNFLQQTHGYVVAKELLDQEITNFEESYTGEKELTAAAKETLLK
ncbi:MAG: hypothetical protein GX029_10515, partial [Pseudomonadaceae bacterium]|nr:hypothetical protein [Pseudomonadaceae bacterium]